MQKRAQNSGFFFKLLSTDLEPFQVLSADNSFKVHVFFASFSKVSGLFFFFFFFFGILTFLTFSRSFLCVLHMPARSPALCTSAYSLFQLETA